MDYVLTVSFAAFGNYTLSLICVSLCVGFGSLPFYHIAETWQDRERAIQKKLAPKLAEFKSVFKGATLNSYVRTLYRQNHYHPIMSVRNSVGLLIQIPFFFAAYNLLSHYSGFNGVQAIFFSDLSKPDGLLKIGDISINIMPFVMTGINLISAAIYAKKTGLREKIQMYGIAALFLVLLYNSPSALLFYWTCNNLFSLLKNLVYSKIYNNGVISASTKKTPEWVKKLFVHVPDKPKGCDRIFLLSAVSLTLLAFIAVPMALMSTGSTADFSDSLLGIIPFLLVFSLVFTAVLYVIYREASEKVQLLLTAAMISLLFCALMNVFVFSGDYGNMSHFIFDDGLSIKETFTSWISTILFFFFFAALYFVFKKGFASPVKSLTVIILLTLVLFSLNGARVYLMTQSEAEKNEIREDTVPKYFNFTKTGQNVVILMTDRFMGGYFPQVLEFMPELKEELSGFTWYSNTLTNCPRTNCGEPAILGGWEYTTHAMNTAPNPDKKTVHQRQDESTRILPYNFDKAGYDVTFYQSFEWFKNENRENLGNSVFTDFDYTNLTKYWMKVNNYEFRSDPERTRKHLLTFGLFRIFPEWMRESIYDKSRWHTAEDADDGNEAEKDPKFQYRTEKDPNRRLASLRPYAVFDLYPEMSTVTDDPKNKFYYATNMFIHEPHLVTDGFGITDGDSIKLPKKLIKKNGNSFFAVRHLYSCTAVMRHIKDWLKWMKENGVYDNTRIIIVSDHGFNLYDPKFKNTQKIPKSHKTKGKPGFYNDFLLVKDFNEKGDLKTDEKFMTSADVPLIATKGIIEAVNPYTGQPLAEPESKFPFYMYLTKYYRISSQGKYKFILWEKYKIKKEADVNNPKKWIRIAPDDSEKKK